MTPVRRVEVFICGERFRRDDAVAGAAVRLLPPEVLAVANLHEAAELPLDTLLAIPPDAPVVVVDAAGGIEPGRIRRLLLDCLAGMRGRGLSSSHAMSLSQALALAAEIRGAPVHGTLVGIGAADVGFGEGLSPLLVARLPAFAETIADEIRRLAAPLPEEAGEPSGDAPASMERPANGRIGP